MDLSCKITEKIETNMKTEKEETVVVDATKSKARTRGKKRKRYDSESSTDIDDVLPENTLEVEKNLQASALKNNLDDVSVKKILKKVVTNDHVLALVKLREEEEEVTAGQNPQPKLTRSKVKELMKVSPKSGRWNLEHLELIPIKHIPVKTRPEVTALIAQELHDDEEDEEYKPTPEDAQSDDDHTLESCSDLESQPATPATPKSLPSASPRVVKDGPFKVPQDIATPTRCKLQMSENEEATIARRTRSKLSLSATPIEHIESSFVPPDDLPTPVVDEIWNEFLEECLNPTSVSRHEEDDETDPEYSVAADPDAHDEDEEALENSIIKISKKELNDLVNELFNIMPEGTAEEVMGGGLAADVTPAPALTEVSSHWEGKQEPISDEEIEKRAPRIIFERSNSVTRLSIGKSEPDDQTNEDTVSASKTTDDSAKEKKSPKTKTSDVAPKRRTVRIAVEERSAAVQPAPAAACAPPPLLRGLRARSSRHHIHIDSAVTILPEQRLILEQQLRQHIQLASSNYLQLYVNPVHWSLAPIYKEYLEQFKKMLESNRESVVNVCNLKPALELVDSWEKSVSEDTPENKKMVEFIQNESERCRRMFSQNNLYVGEFPATFKSVVANTSNVFLYPYLLPAMPYRADSPRRFSYKRSEDEYIILGLDQFWQYVEDNPQLFKLRAQQHQRRRAGLAVTSQLVCKHMLPWLSPKWLLGHIHKARKEKGSPLYNFFESRCVVPVQHKLLPYNPDITLYEQPEHEMPRIWIRHLAKSSKRFRDHLYRRKNAGSLPLGGVDVQMGEAIKAPKKKPLPIDFTKTIVSNRADVLPKITPVPLSDKFDIDINLPGSNMASPLLNSTQNVLTAVNVLSPADLIPAGGNANRFIVVGDGIGTKTTIDVPEVQNSTIDTIVKPQSSFMMSPNMYRVVETSTGGYLVPLTMMQTSTINSIDTPVISSTKTIVSNRANVLPKITPVPLSDKFDIDINLPGSNMTSPLLNSTQSVLTAVNVLSPADLIPAGGNANRFIVVGDGIGTKTTIDVPGVQNSTIDTIVKPQSPFMMSSNMYRVVETSTGGYLVPLTMMQTSTINSIDTPVISSIEGANSTIIANDLPEDVTKETANKTKVKNHCECCVLLRKICKGKQTFITDFFKPKTSEVKKCECSNKRYPNISKRLKLLVNNYKNQSWLVHRLLQSKLDLVKNEIEDNKGGSRSEAEATDSSFSLDDIAYVTSFQLRLTLRSGIIRNTYLKKHINTTLSKFDPGSDDALDLAEKLYKIFEVDLADMYKEFLGFLTPEQADKIGKFKDYFTQCCVPDLLKKIEEEVTDKESKRKILAYLSGVFVNSALSACELCSGLLATLHAHPRLARHVFSLFPHRLTEKPDGTEPTHNGIASENPTRPVNTDTSTVPQVCVVTAEHDPPADGDADDTLTICDEAQNMTTMDYEADHSSSGEECNLSVVEGPGTTQQMDTIVYEEQRSPKVLDTPELTIGKTEVQEYCESTDMSTMVISEDEPIKSEAPEWKREEDKLILEVLLQHILPARTNDKTIPEIVAEKNVPRIVSESLTHKSIEEIRVRVLYLLEILVLTKC